MSPLQAWPARSDSNFQSLSTPGVTPARAVMGTLSGTPIFGPAL
jgi:hypothetical protein